MSRRLLAALASAVWGLSLLGVTVGFVLGRAVYDRGVVYGDPGPALPDLDGPLRAVNTQLELEPDAEAQRRALAMIRTAGFGWIRQQFQWADLEPGGKGQFYDYDRQQPTWARYDQIVDLARAEGLRVIARIDVTPAWARPPGTYKSHPPSNVRDFEDFVYAFVTHYRGQISYIQLWNEPNLNSEWGNQPVDPAGYVALLKAGYAGAKRADPSVRVLSAELAQTLEPDAPGAQGLDDLLYLERMYEYGAKPYFDVLAANAYGLWTGPEDRQVGDPYTNFSRVLLVRQIMERHGDGGKPLWVTEFGWNALPPGWQGNPSPWGQVTAANQAHFILGAYRRAALEWPWMGPMALWLFRQPHADPRDPTQYFGLVDTQWRPQPAYQALVATAPTQALGIGVHQESSAGMVWTGTWQVTSDPAASLGGLRESPVSGATLRLRFEGTKLELLAPVGPSRGIAYVKIDGVSALANRLPLNAHGQATLDCYAPAARQQARLLIADHLPLRPHELELTVSGEHDARSDGPGVGIDAVIVSRERPLLPLAVLGATWAITLAALAWAERPRVLALVGRLADEERRTNDEEQTTKNERQTTNDEERGIVAAASLTLGRLLRNRPLRQQHLLAAARVIPSVVRPSSFVLFQSVPWRKLATLTLAAGLPLAPLAIRTPLGHYALPELLTLALVGLTAARTYVDGRWPGAPGAYAWPALCLLAAGAISVIVAEYPHVALRELRIVVVEPVLFYLAARAALRGPRDGVLLAAAMLAGATGAATIALAQTATGRGLIAAEGVARAAALYPSPNNLALLLDRAVPLAAAFTLGRQRVSGPRPGRAARQSSAARYLAPLAFIICAGALFFTFSRGAWLATIAGLAVVASPWLQRLARLPPARRRRLLAKAAAIGLPLLAIAAILAMRVERFRSLFRATGTGILRLYVWQAALDMVRDHPCWGIGLDQFLYLYPRYIRPEAWREPNLSHPHNLVLDLWLRLGLPGLAIFAWLLWTLVGRLRGALGAAQLTGTRSRQRLALGAAGAGVAALVHGLVDNFYFVPDLAYTWWIMLLLVELAGERRVHEASAMRRARSGAQPGGPSTPGGAA